MEFDLTKTVLVFAVLITAGTAALVGMGVMATGTVLMMVTPAMVVFGTICLALGVKYGEYRTTH